MSKYDEFVSKLKKETSETEIVDLTKEIKMRYRSQETKKPHFKRLSYAFMGTFILLLVICISVFVVKGKDTTKPPAPSYYVPQTVNETYAFELLAAANFLYSSDTTTTQSLSFLTTSKENLNEISNKINKHYLTIQNLLNGEKINYSVTKSTKEGYTDQMTITTLYSDSFDLQYTIYFNKTLVEIDDDEEIYNLDGIIVIDNVEYQIKGETEIENDETSTKIKVITGKSSYFIIEQEAEENEKEFVYKKYQNNKIIKEYALSHEIEDGEVEVKIEIMENGKEEEIKAKLENGKITLKVELENYEGVVKVTVINDEINYYFVNEKTNIVINIIKNKKNLNFTNKNLNSFVY